MKIARAQRTLRSRLAYLRAKLERGWSPVIQSEHDALDLALRMLKWRDEIDVEIDVETQRALVHVLPRELRVVERATRGDRLAAQASAVVADVRQRARVA